VAGAVTIVFAFGAQGESIQALVGPHGFDAVPAAGEHFVDVGLVADVEDELIGGGVKDPVKGDAQFHDAQIRAQVTAGSREGVNQVGPDGFGERRKFPFIELFDIGWAADVKWGGRQGTGGFFRHGSEVGGTRAGP
jgi:hypothetical protein